MDTKKLASAPVRVREHTRKQLKIVAALTGESMLAVLDRLVSAELERIQGERIQQGSTSKAQPKP